MSPIKLFSNICGPIYLANSEFDFILFQRYLNLKLMSSRPQASIPWLSIELTSVLVWLLRHFNSQNADRIRILDRDHL